VSYKVVNHPAVEEDIASVLTFYKSAGKRIINEFLSRLLEVNDYLKTNPYSFQVRYKEVRLIMLKQFPFQLHYIIDEFNKSVIVLAIVHTYRKPSDFSER
jgi:plasmid stabilization system protein ParE